MYKFLFWSVFIGGIAIGLLSFSFSESYQKSIQAKWYYQMGEYQRAYDLAKEAKLLDPYNKMAFGVERQSELSLQFVRYIEDSNQYLSEIQAIVEKDPINIDDRIRVKMMCEVMIGEYERFRETVMTEEELVQAAKANFEKFKKIYETVY